MGDTEEGVELLLHCCCGGGIIVVGAGTEPVRGVKNVLALFKMLLNSACPLACVGGGIGAGDTHAVVDWS